VMDSQRSSQDVDFSSLYGAYSQYGTSSSRPHVPKTPPPSIGGVPIHPTPFLLPAFVGAPFLSRPFQTPRSPTTQRTAPPFTERHSRCSLQSLFLSRV
ncbi:hypothetical protein L7F22_016048, partial [Adiantum nelumboides]|nr:hypothetical protein [Adiantum nelumboides]